MCNCGGGGRAKELLTVTYANGTSIRTTSQATLRMAEAHGALITNSQGVRVNAAGVPI